MKQLKHLLSSTICLILLFSFTLLDSANGQQVNKVFDEIGGGGSSSSKNEDSGSDNTLFIVGGVVIVGILVYALLREKKETVKKDTTSAIEVENILSQSFDSKYETSVQQSDIPINIFLGSQSVNALYENKRYFIGVSYNF